MLPRALLLCAAAGLARAAAAPEACGAAAGGPCRSQEDADIATAGLQAEERAESASSSPAAVHLLQKRAVATAESAAPETARQNSSRASGDDLPEPDELIDDKVKEEPPARVFQGSLSVSTPREDLAQGARAQAEAHPENDWGRSTMWTLKKESIIGSACQYANPQNGGLKAPSAVSPYIKSGRFCAVNTLMWDQGRICGECFRIIYDGRPATDPGRPGQAIIQIVDSGADNNFDCEIQAFHQITGTNTGIFPVHFQHVPCATAFGGARATVIAATRYYVIVVFSNLVLPVRSADMLIGRTPIGLWRNAATFQGSTALPTNQIQGQVSFHIVLTNGEHIAFKNCFPKWPQRVSSWCTETGYKDTRPTDVPEPTSAPGGKECIPRFAECDLSHGIQCCPRDDRGPLVCLRQNKYFAQCLPPSDAHPQHPGHTNTHKRKPQPVHENGRECSKHPRCSGLRGNCCPSYSGKNLICCR